MMNLLQKINAARDAFHALKLEKTGHNKFAGYHYFELGDFLIPALRVFSDVGLLAVVSFDKDVASMRIFDEVNPEVPPLVITSPMGSAALKGCHEVQNIGAVETYQRRYLWVAALEIVEHDALDATTGKDTNGAGVIKATEGAENLVPADQREYLAELAERLKSFGAFENAFSALEAEQLDNDQKVYLWSLLPSHIRSGIKKIGEARKAQHAN